MTNTTEHKFDNHRREAICSVGLKNETNSKK